MADPREMGTEHLCNVACHSLAVASGLEQRSRRLQQAPP
jgi:hypothetical protein